jgi:hypothetical protein
MRKVIVFLVLLAFWAPVIAHAQLAVPSPAGLGFPSLGSVSDGIGASGIVSRLPQLGGIDWDEIMWNPYAQVGYAQIGSNFTLPIQGQPDPTSALQIGSLDMWFEHSDFWTATVGVNAILSPQFSFFGMAVGAFPRKFVAPGTMWVRLAVRRQRKWESIRD